MPGHNISAATEDYDFILVGAGSASCLIASRLSQQLPNHRILILEAGEHIRNDPKVQTPGLSVSLQSDPMYDWQYASVSEPTLNGRSIKHPRGKLVGGTSAINSHSVVFPNHEWQDRVAEELLPESGRADWNTQGMKDCYERFEAQSSGLKAGDDVDSLDRVKTSGPPSSDFLRNQWIKAFEELDHAQCASGFVESSTGAVIVANAIDGSKGERSHAGTAFMDHALGRGNVTLKTGIKVDKIIFDEASTDGKLNARGVSYTFRGKIYQISARELIVCAGVFESPAILERSGIGAKQVLEAANVPVLYELPGVGENLQDHLNCSLSCEIRDDIPTRDEEYRNPEVRRAVAQEYERSHTGPLSEGGAYSFAFTPLQILETDAETQELTDMVQDCVKNECNANLRAQYSIIQKAIEELNEATATTFMIPSQRHRDMESLPKGSPRLVDGKYVTVAAMLAHPFSRGSCHITPDPSQHSEIKFNYLSHPLDTEIFARHLRLIERLFQKPTFTAIRKPDGRRLPRTFPHPVTSLEYAKKMLPVNVATNYHPCGTCAMMKEELGGVVDERLRVYGTRNVRVCDASVLPLIPRGNILTAVYAFAEKAVELIVREVGAEVS